MSRRKGRDSYRPLRTTIHRVILGGIVTESLGVWTPFRNPMCAWAFAETVFERDQPDDLDITITLESEERMGNVQGHLEIVSGTIEMMEKTIAAIKNAPQVETPVAAPASESPKKGSFLQACIGSKEFFNAFVHYWAATIGPKSAGWESMLLRELETAKPVDMLWIDMLRPGQVFRGNAREMMCRNIGSMVA